MSARLNHTIVWCRDPERSATFLSTMFGLSEPRPFGRFMVVETANGVSLDFAAKEGPVARQHYAFIVSETEFDAIMDRIHAQGLTYWADPARTRIDEINRHYGGRGVYFEDPDGHLLEAITKPYGSEA